MAAAKQKKRRNTIISNDIANFKLPESLGCSDINFPIVTRKKQTASWKEIVAESENFQKELKLKYCPETVQKPPTTFLRVETDYIVDEVFPVLIPAIEDTLRKAKTWEVLTTQNSFFNGVDHIAQYLWNHNPRYPARIFNDDHIFNMPWVRNYLREHPRQVYPKSWLWPEEHAIITIQKYIRGYLVRCNPEVAEMRTFWKKVKYERENPDMETNPTLYKHFAAYHPKHGHVSVASQTQHRVSVHHRA